MHDDKLVFLQQLQSSLTEKTFVSITLGKSKSEDISKIHASIVEIKGLEQVQLHYTYKTNDQVKNFLFEDLSTEIEKYVGESFFHVILKTTNQQYELKYNKKYKPRLLTQNIQTSKKVNTNDNHKTRFITTKNNIYLKELGVLNDQGQILKAKGDKYKQICRYVEIMANLITKTFVDENALLKIADMGSGSGYLTFALTDYLNNFSQYQSQVVGLELRQELVEKCNTIRDKSRYNNLSFEAGLIEDYENEINVLIALHACDTATDDALLKGIKANAELIVCAPCCHKEIRKQLDSKITIPEILRHNIYQERFSEMLTDSLRAMILEAFGYKVQVFEFIGSEHAGKNSMITALKKQQVTNPDFSQIKALMAQFGIEKQSLLGCFEG